MTPHKNGKRPSTTPGKGKKKELVDHSKVPVKPGLELVVFEQLCLRAQTPFAQYCLYLLDSGEWLSLVQLQLDFGLYEAWVYTGYRTVDDFFFDYQLSCFFKKYRGVSIPGVDPEAKAFEKWLAAEERCKATNEMFRKRWDGLTSSSAVVESVLSRSRRKIASILGAFSLERVRKHCRFGPKSDLDVPKRKASSVLKYSTPGSVTPWASQALIDTLSCDGYDVRELYVNSARRVTYAELTFVPKKATVERSIEISARWNLFLQLGIGGPIQEQLLDVGIDITDQSVNQYLASVAHRRGLATRDLSSASDTIATNLVIDQLADADEGWLDYMLKCRTPQVLYKGQAIRLEKFAGMGNGYTFPLETLIFYALAYSVAREVGICQKRIHQEVKVYGDDIVVPQECVELLDQVLTYCGFIINHDKSYAAGQFYESCGQDYFFGRNVRPIFIEEKVGTIEDVYVLCNQLAALAARFCNNPGFASRKIWNIRQHLVQRVPRHLRCFGPPEAGDGVIHSTLDAYRPTIRKAGDGWQGVWVRCMKTVPLNKWSKSYYGHLYSKLDGVTSMGNLVPVIDQKRWILGETYVLTYGDTVLV